MARPSLRLRIHHYVAFVSSFVVTACVWWELSTYTTLPWLIQGLLEMAVMFGFYFGIRAILKRLNPSKPRPWG